MPLRYLDSTPPQIARVVGAWILGFGGALFFLTFKELGSVNPPMGAIMSLVFACAGILALVVGSKRLGKADQANRRFFSENAGTEILASRRRLQVKLESGRIRLIIAVLMLATCWIVFAGGYDCDGDVCTGFIRGQETLMTLFMWLVIVLGLTTLIVWTLARVHGNETDRWEDLASDYLRRKDDGPTPGLKRSRWE